MKFSFVLVDESAAEGLAPIAPARLALMAADYEAQLNNEVSAEWGGSYAVRVDVSRERVLPSEIACIIVGTLPDPNEEAYHSALSNGAPFAFFRNDTGLEEAISHELCEIVGNPAANLWAMKADQKTLQAHELCDRVQGSGYAGRNGTTLANFLLRAGLTPGAPGPWDYRGMLGGAEDRTLNGYEIDAPLGAVSDVFGVRLVGNVEPYGLVRLAHWSSRAHRIGLRFDPDAARVALREAVTPVRKPSRPE